MILIADSGSTKADWAMLPEHGGGALTFSSDGLNPALTTPSVLRQTLLGTVASQVSRFCNVSARHELVSHIYFYGAGCTPELSAVMRRELSQAFPGAAVSVASDLLGACIALFGSEGGIACILGTGSASCVFDGHNIVRQVPSLGYVLGDEGSGAVLGRMLVSDALKGCMPPLLLGRFETEYRLTPAQAIAGVYRSDSPSRYLASFVPFLHKHRHEDYVQTLLRNAFDAFFARNIAAYPTAHLSAGFVGSIAFHFEEEVRAASSRAGVEVSRIVQKPIHALMEHYSTNII